MKFIAFARSDRKSVIGGIQVSLLAIGVALGGCTTPPVRSAGTIREPGATVVIQAVQSKQGSLLYLAPDDEDNLQLAVLLLSAKKPTVLTQTPYGIMDYGVSGDGEIVVYSAWREDGGTDLWSIQVNGQNNRLLVSCENAACGRIAWMPEGKKQFAYEKHGGPEGSGSAVLWQFDWEAQTTRPMVSDSPEAHANASWSPDGNWISYYSPDKAVTEVVNVADGRRYALSHGLGDPVAWDPASKALLSLEVRPDGDQRLAHLFRLDLDSGNRRDIGATRIADRQPAWSPTGDWLAVTRRDWRGKYPSKTQIWLMKPDGTEAHPVLAESEYQYLSPVWSPDGKSLLFQRYSNDQVFVQPEVWRVALETGVTEQVLPSGGQVAWLP